jgi:hypothetical protein
MKTKYWVVITLMIAIATPAVAQITGAGGTGSLGGTSTNGIGGSIGAPNDYHSNLRHSQFEPKHHSWDDSDNASVDEHYSGT